MMLQGKNVFLRPPKTSDFPVLLEWGKDPLNPEWDSTRYPTSWKQCDAWLRSIESNRHNVHFMICHNSGTPIGVIEIDHIAWRSGDGELRIAIAERSMQDKGYGSEAIRLILRHAFHDLKLSRIYLRVYATNTRAVRTYERCGFKREGIIRRRAADGSSDEIILMTLSKTSLSESQTLKIKSYGT